jgi:diguanylate cyclase (GGDEF)-like protein
MIELHEKNPGLVQALAEEDDRARDELLKAGNTDGLTGLFTRRCLDELLPKLLKHTKRDEVEDSLLIIDANRFKEINDNHGHLAGDDVLRTMAAIVKTECRGTDFAFRYGGDELVIFMPNTSIEGALAAAERIKEKIAEEKITVKNSNGQPIELSGLGVSVGCSNTKDIGVIKGQPSEEIMGRLIAMADVNLYANKGKTNSAK